MIIESWAIGINESFKGRCGENQKVKYCNGIACGIVDKYPIRVWFGKKFKTLGVRYKIKRRIKGV